MFHVEEKRMPAHGAAFLFIRNGTSSMSWQDHIESTPTILRGKPRIRGTRIPVSLILGYLASGRSREEILADFPDLRPEHVSACLDYARELAEFEVPA
jgi:uncharacterized protein (DUF433 family)